MQHQYPFLYAPVFTLRGENVTVMAWLSKRFNVRSWSGDYLTPRRFVERSASLRSFSGSLCPKLSYKRVAASAFMPGGFRGVARQGTFPIAIEVITPVRPVRLLELPATSEFFTGHHSLL